MENSAAGLVMVTVSGNVSRWPVCHLFRRHRLPQTRHQRHRLQPWKRRHRQPRLALDLAAQDRRRREERVEAVHDLARRDLAPLELVRRVREHGQEDLVRDELEVLEHGVALALEGDDRVLQLLLRVRQRLGCQLHEEEVLPLDGLLDVLQVLLLVGLLLVGLLRQKSARGNKAYTGLVRVAG